MRLLIDLALRNLFRQKRRNILLGISIALGMTLLVMSNSLTKGFSDLLLNKFMVNAFGHIQITMNEKGNMRQGVFRDKARYEAIIQENVKGLKVIKESLPSFSRVIGNGTAEQAVLVGIPYTEEMKEYFESERREGRVEDYTNKTIENPVVITSKKAQDLNVKLGDTIKMRMSTIYGQQQTARLTVSVLSKSSSFFETMSMYVELDRQKKLLGYNSWESGNLQIELKAVGKPEEASKQADRLHKALTPKPAYTLSTVNYAGRTADALSLGFYTNDSTVKLLTEKLSIQSKLTNTNWIQVTNQVLVSKPLSAKLGLTEGKSFDAHYECKFGGRYTNHYTVAGVFTPGELPDNVILVNEQTFFKKLQEFTPVRKVTPETKVLDNTNLTVYSALSTEYKLMYRVKDFMAWQKKSTEMAKTKYNQPVMDINTLYEMFSIILQMEGGINMIMFVVLLVLFLIILSGLVNTLRMTIRERTREIGTVRAIGMQRNDVRLSFVFEVFFLSLSAAITGIIVAFIAMGLLSLWRIDTTSVLSMFLWKNHLYFMPSAGNLIAIIAMLILFTLIWLIIKNFEWLEERQRWLWLILGHIGFTAIEVMLLSSNMIVMSIFMVIWTLFTIPAFIIVIRNIMKKKQPQKMPGYFLIQLVVLACCIYVLNAGVLTSLLLILGITMVTASFPANEGAKLSAADALRHYE